MGRAPAPLSTAPPPWPAGKATAPADASDASSMSWTSSRARPSWPYPAGAGVAMSASPGARAGCGARSCLYGRIVCWRHAELGHRAVGRLEVGCQGLERLAPSAAQRFVDALSADDKGKERGQAVRADEQSPHGRGRCVEPRCVRDHPRRGEYGGRPAHRPGEPRPASRSAERLVRRSSRPGPGVPLGPGRRQRLLGPSPPGPRSWPTSRR